MECYCLFQHSSIMARSLGGVQPQPRFEPLYSKPNLVYCSPSLPCSSNSPVPGLLFTNLVFLPIGAHVLLSVALLPVPPNPSTICCLAGAPFTVRPSFLPFAYIVDLLASPTPREEDATPVGVCEPKANPWADNPLVSSLEIISPTHSFLP
ncbi:hypothetical protein TIFTF001_032152 [Ficus carica]|uniref:Uncharacterized protein n=1 Tax=Ficus carica TaxID=3494 RepID=A0AA88DWG1_FICCA|nr:hypothetical protein TIFTF001_032152 [Ficus carica]